MARPGKVLRGALIVFGVLFVPVAIVLLLRHRWLHALMLLLITGWFVRTGLTRDENSWMTLIDELDSGRR